MAKPVIGSVPYLNATPLVEWFSTSPGQDAAELTLASPSFLAGMISNGEVSVALASSFFALSEPDLKCVENVSISSFGPVESVRLFSKVPFSEIQSLALDDSSLTSTHLAQILLGELYDIQPRTLTVRPSQQDMLSVADACVLIGDAGMAAPSGGLHTLDLGEAWHKLTGLPFVWALWIGGDRLTPQLSAMLQTAKRFGLERIETVAENHAAEHGFSVNVARRYLAEIIDFDLTALHLAGLQQYATFCKKYGFITSDRMPTLMGAAPLDAHSSI